MQAPAPSSTRPKAAGGAALAVATALGLAAAAVLACTLPATVRVSAGGGATEGAPRVWMALAASALGPMACAIVVLRGAREGLRAFAGPGAGVRIFGATLGLSALLAGLSVFGSVLRAATHHRALAGVTFAMGGLGLTVVVAVVCRRVVFLLERAGSMRRLIAEAALGLAVATTLSWVGLRFAAAASRDPASSSAAGIVVDVLAFALAALFAARPSFAQRRGLALAGPAAALLIAVLGFSMLRHLPIRTAIEERAPAFAPLADLVPST